MNLSTALVPVSSKFTNWMNSQLENHRTQWRLTSWFHWGSWGDRFNFASCLQKINAQTCFQHTYYLSRKELLMWVRTFTQFKIYLLFNLFHQFRGMPSKEQSIINHFLKLFSIYPYIFPYQWFVLNLWKCLHGHFKNVSESIFLSINFILL